MCALLVALACGARVRIVKPGYASHGSGKSAGRAVAVGFVLRAAPTERTEQLLRVHNLTYTPRTDPRGLIKRLQDFNNSDPRADRVCAMAELSYLGGMEAQRIDKQVALDLFGASVLYSYQYLFDDRYHSTRNPYDPQYRGVCDLYNSALESGLRIICTSRELKPETSKTINTASGTWDITCKLRGSQWRPARFRPLRVRLGF